MTAITKKLIHSFSHAIRGISTTFRNQFNLRVHFVVALLVTVVSFYVQLSPLEWTAILLCIGSVISAELINTSIELHIDLTTPERNEKAGQAKDIAAGAVLVVAIISAVIGMIIILPKLLLLN